MKKFLISYIAILSNYFFLVLRKFLAKKSTFPKEFFENRKIFMENF